MSDSMYLHLFGFDGCVRGLALHFFSDTHDGWSERLMPFEVCMSVLVRKLSHSFWRFTTFLAMARVHVMTPIWHVYFRQYG